jgi:hypothetical protein
VCCTPAQILSNIDGVNTETSGLVADYSFEAVPPTDQTSNDMPLIPVNSPIYALNIASLQLDGSNYVDCGANTLLSFGGFDPYTFEGWVNLGPTVVGGPILSRFDGGVAAEYSFNITANGNVESYRNVVPWNIVSNATLGANEWHHIATTYDGENLSIYIDGNLDSQAPFISQPGFPDQNTLVGASYNQGQVANFFTGNIQNLRVWNSALDQNNIQIAMQGPIYVPPGLVANLDFSCTPPSDLTGNITLSPTPGCIYADQAFPISVQPQQSAASLKSPGAKQSAAVREVAPA